MTHCQIQSYMLTYDDTISKNIRLPYLGEIYGRPRRLQLNILDSYLIPSNEIEEVHPTLLDLFTFAMISHKTASKLVT